jgi:hypothetical protein
MPDDSLNGSSITITTDGISDEQKATDKFKSAYQDMLTQLLAPGFIPILCAHEAAHVIYFSALGLGEQYNPFPAKLQYDFQIDDYSGHLAAVQFPNIPKWTEGKFREWLSNVARALAAGGVVARKLMPSTDGGDQDDRDRFKKLCEYLNTDPNLSLDWENLWKQAQESILQELEQPGFLAAIETVASELRPSLGL